MTTPTELFPLPCPFCLMNLRPIYGNKFLQHEASNCILSEFTFTRAKIQIEQWNFRKCPSSYTIDESKLLGILYKVNPSCGERIRNEYVKAIIQQLPNLTKDTK